MNEGQFTKCKKSMSLVNIEWDLPMHFFLCAAVHHALIITLKHLFHTDLYRTYTSFQDSLTPTRVGEKGQCTSWLSCLTTGYLHLSCSLSWPGRKCLSFRSDTSVLKTDMEEPFEKLHKKKKKRKEKAGREGINFEGNQTAN